ncbi:DUF4870 domain-containing protein [Leucobacter zeae]|nr:DUF4870 domain-containing protein [Leucobacter zeae]
MTTLPPEGQDDQAANAPAPQTPAPSAPAPDAPAFDAPAAPSEQAPAPQYSAPQAPTAPPAPEYTQAPPQAPQYQQPQQGYQQPPAGGGYQPPQQGYAQPVADPVSNITLNYWLSVFFVWVPALIFFFIEKDKGNRQAYVFHRDNLNFSLLRTGLYIVIIIASMIPYANLILVPIIWIAQIVAFVFHIIAAAKAPENFRNGQQPGFILNVPFVK